MGRGMDRQEQGELSNLWVVWGWRPGAKFGLEVTDLPEVEVPGNCLDPEA